jgi:hypothetical protein
MTVSTIFKPCESRSELEEASRNNRCLFMLQMNSKWTYKSKWFGLRKVKDECTIYYELVPCKLKRATDNGDAYIYLDKAFARDTMYHVPINDIYYNA